MKGLVLLIDHPRQPFKWMFLIFLLCFWVRHPVFGQSDSLLERAHHLAQKIVIVDSHIDLPYRLMNHPADLSVRTPDGHFDYPRAISGGLNVAFMALYIPAEYQEKESAKDLTNRLIQLVKDLQVQWPQKFQIVSSPADIRQHLSAQKILLALGIENGAAIGDSLSNLEYFYNQGVRYMTLTHSRNNLICDASFDAERKWRGISPFGMKVIHEMNRLGMMIDVSHVSDQAFYQIIDQSLAPVIASHSACRYFTPGFERNMDDEMILTLARGGGIIQIPFGSFFLKEDVYQAGEKVRIEVDQYIQNHQLSQDDALVSAFRNKLRADNQVDPGDVTLLVDQIDHVVKLVGIDYVGLGSDFEGVSMVPRNLSDVSCYPFIIKELLRRGYTEYDIAKICGENFLRVWEEVENLRSQ